MKACLYAFAALLFCLQPEISPAQTSVGFKDPADPASLGALRDYRLPDWGYRTTTLRFNGQGGGSSSESRGINSSSASESFAHLVTRMGERRTWTLAMSQSGDWNWAQQHYGDEKAIQGNLKSGIGGHGSVSDYLSDIFFLRGSVSLNGEYKERRDRNREARAVGIDRSFSTDMRLGVGLGRIRDVTPVLIALRMNERLGALGRQPLSTEQVKRLADALARSSGYGTVFDRPDRRFWRDVLEPLEGEGTPLAPYEVFYLREATFESLGARLEGQQIEGGLMMNRRTVKGAAPRDLVGPWLSGSWSHNASLNHQLSANIFARYVRDLQSAEVPFAERTDGLIDITGRHFWNIADRASWENGLEVRLGYLEFAEPRVVRHQTSVSLSSRVSYYVEDRISLVPSVEYVWSRASTVRFRKEDIRTWQVRIGLVYDVGRSLL